MWITAAAAAAVSVVPINRQDRNWIWWYSPNPRCFHRYFSSCRWLLWRPSHQVNWTLWSPAHDRCSNLSLITVHNISSWITLHYILQLSQQTALGSSTTVKLQLLYNNVSTLEFLLITRFHNAWKKNDSQFFSSNHIDRLFNNLALCWLRDAYH